MIKNLAKKTVVALMTGIVLSSCNGLFSNIYDEPAESTASDYGFVQKPTGSTPGRVYINATDYRRWTYIDFHTMTFDTLDVDEPEPKNWDIAIHRYDAKTNGGAVLETGASGFAGLENMPGLAQGEFVADEWTTETIVTDMSTMMDGYLSYQESYYNRELSKWLNVDKSTMPPIYTPSNKVYIVRLADGTHVALRLVSFMNGMAVKGYMTIEYKYPFNI